LIFRHTSKKRKSDKGVVNSAQNDIACNVQEDFFCVFYFVFDYFTKFAKSGMLPKTHRSIYEY